METFTPLSRPLSVAEKESIKRVREEYQIPLRDQPSIKARRMGGMICGHAPTWDGRVDACAGSLTHRGLILGPSPHPGGSPSPPSWIAGSCTVHSSPSIIEVTRADSGRFSTFVFRPSVTYTWDRRGECYRESSDKGVGYELTEVVRATVSACSAKAPAAHPVAVLKRSRDDGAVEFVRGNASSAGAESSTYYYEVSQTSRSLHPPPMESSPIAGADASGRSWYAHTTPALVVDSLLRCSAEEAHLVDPGAWVLLYKGRHVNSEAGRELLGRDLLGRDPVSTTAADHMSLQSAGSTQELQVIQLCAFRKF